MAEDQVKKASHPDALNVEDWFVQKLADDLQVLKEEQESLKDYAANTRKELKLCQEYILFLHEELGLPIPEKFQDKQVPFVRTVAGSSLLDGSQVIERELTREEQREKVLAEDLTACSTCKYLCVGEGSSIRFCSKRNCVLENLLFNCELKEEG